jgi:flagellar capping protein FliD
LGRSGITKLENLFADVLGASGSHDTTVSVYESKSKSLASRLDKLTQREAVLKAHYTTSFSNMEKLVTDSKSSASLIENFIGVWDKKK